MKIILFLLFIHNLMAQPGPIQTQEAGISNYQIQATTPTTTPIAGKQYLYNANDVLSTKDSLNNVQRVNKNYDNYVPNFDLEQGLTPYLFTAGRAVINSATPLEGLKSLDFDGTALNDFIETPLVTIPRLLMGNTCMVKASIKGGDANLQLQLINGAGTIIAFKQLEVYPDSSSQFLTFNCPTQALITGTPALGQLKIKITQSTATNSALATLDSFYLGRFESNTMVVQGQVEEVMASTISYAVGNTQRLDFSNVVKNSISNCGIVTINNPISRFSYTGKTDCLVNISAGFTTPNGTIFASPSINLNGAPIALQYQNMAGTTPSGTSHNRASVSLIVKNGDVLDVTVAIQTVTLTPGNGANLSLTATPIPQLATIVSTNQMRAGWLGRAIWATAGCGWTKSATGNTAFTPVPACSTGYATSGLAIPDLVTPGQLPAITFSSLKGKGIIRFELLGGIRSETANNCTFQMALNGTIATSVRKLGVNSAVQASYPAIILEYTLSTDLINPKFEVFAGSIPGAGNCKILADPSVDGVGFIINAYYEPDLSDPYSTNELFAVLPPQVQNSSGKEWRVEGCRVNNGGTSSLIGNSCNGWIASSIRNSIGSVTVNFLGNPFSESPNCNCSIISAGAVTCNVGATTTAATVTLYIGTTGALIDHNFQLTCVGPK